MMRALACRAALSPLARSSYGRSGPGEAVLLPSSPSLCNNVASLRVPAGAGRMGGSTKDCEPRGFSDLGPPFSPKSGWGGGGGGGARLGSRSVPLPRLRADGVPWRGDTRRPPGNKPVPQQAELSAGGGGFGEEQLAEPLTEDGAQVASGCIGREDPSLQRGGAPVTRSDEVRYLQLQHRDVRLGLGLRVPARLQLRRHHPLLLLRDPGCADRLRLRLQRRPQRFSTRAQRRTHDPDLRAELLSCVRTRHRIGHHLLVSRLCCQALAKAVGISTCRFGQAEQPRLGDMPGHTCSLAFLLLLPFVRHPRFTRRSATHSLHHVLARRRLVLRRAGRLSCRNRRRRLGLANRHACGDHLRLHRRKPIPRGVTGEFGFIHPRLQLPSAGRRSQALPLSRGSPLPQRRRVGP
mmetsp:Transcript_1548/g.4963  ORF Transcript_1548/g.4963 Transcript_1548/m.4963 type:complete len:407 (-) Transcript_1548:358-1578(-)